MLEEVGNTVRYASIGAGIVDRHLERKFQGQDRLFAVIYFPHKNMEVQLPVGDPAVQKKLSKVASKTKLKADLRDFGNLAETLPRTWDVREQHGDSVLNSGNPEEWITLLASYAYAEGAGVSVAASDADIVRDLKELISAELACADSLPFEEAEEYIEKSYNRFVKKLSKRGEKSDSYVTVKI